MTDDAMRERINEMLRSSAEIHRMAEVLVRCLLGAMALAAAVHAAARMGWL